MLPWLIVLGLIGATGRTLSELLADRVARFPSSGEINRRLADPAGALAAIRERYVAHAVRVDTTDGIGIEFERWRFNLRPSNTEPLVRLNVESRGDRALLDAKTAELLTLLEAHA